MSDKNVRYEWLCYLLKDHTTGKVTGPFKSSTFKMKGVSIPLTESQITLKQQPIEVECWWLGDSQDFSPEIEERPLVCDRWRSRVKAFKYTINEVALISETTIKITKKDEYVCEVIVYNGCHVTPEQYLFNPLIIPGVSIKVVNLEDATVSGVKWRVLNIIN